MESKMLDLLLGQEAVRNPLPELLSLFLHPKELRHNAQDSIELKVIANRKEIINSEKFAYICSKKNLVSQAIFSSSYNLFETTKHPINFCSYRQPRICKKYYNSLSS